MRLKFTLLFFSTLLAYSLVSAQNTALSFTTANSDNASTSAYLVPSSGDFTVELWFNVPSNATTMEFVSQGSSGTGFYLGILGTNGQFRAGDGWQTTDVSVPVNQWAHLAVTSAAGVGSLYLNGALVATNNTYSVSSAGSGSFFTIGQQFSPFFEYLTGTLDQIRVWSLALTQAQVKQTMYGTVSPSATGLVADYEMNDGSGTTVSNSTSTTGLNATLGSSGTNASWVASPVQFGSNAVNLDGASTQVTAPSSTAFELPSGTIEAEINPTTWLINPVTSDPENMEIAGYRSPSTTAYSFHVSSVGVSFWNGTSFVQWDYAGVNATSGVPYTVPLGSWTQLSWVSDGTKTTLYVNGTSVGYFPVTFAANTGLTFNVGYTVGSTVEYFLGSIDEVRVWNTQQTPALITQYMGKTLTGTETGLNALYSFDQGIASGTNTGLITAVDNTINSNNATLTNFALTGTTSNFVTSAVVPLPVNFTSFTATKAGSQSLLQWQTAQEENSHDFSIERSTDGTTYTSVGDVPAAGNSTKPTNYSFIDPTPKTGLNYYRLKESDAGGQYMYSEVRTVTFPTSATQTLAWYVSGNKTVQVSLLNGSNEFYSLSDINGRTIQKGQLSSGKLYLSGVASGVYIVNVVTFTGQQLVDKVLIP
jgi:Concanavalin A-like lectin/glucanases superfamily